MTAPIRFPARSRIGAAESWMAISWPRREMSAVCCVKPEHLPLAQAPHDGALACLARALIDHRQHVAHQPSLRLAVLPARQALRHRVHVVDAPFGVRGDHRIADRLQRHLRALLGLEHGGLGLLALGDVGDRALVAGDPAAACRAPPARCPPPRSCCRPCAAARTRRCAPPLRSPCASRTFRDRSDTSTASAAGNLIDLLRRGESEHLHEGGIDRRPACLRGWFGTPLP